ncbi:hypothetical protein SEA_BLAB_94 [Microbacterium phage Blab]|nr:hypothetical protein SEA_BLAB_94 [Microbacterium phage Blab]
MGAHNQSTLAVARDRANAVVTLLKEYPGDDHVAQYWIDEIETILETGRTEGTLKAWMQRHDGDPIDTLQTTIRVAYPVTTCERHGGEWGDDETCQRCTDIDGKARRAPLVGVIEPGRPWAPGSRRVDAARATRVVLDGSSRDYAGVTTFLVTERGYIGFASFGEDAVQMLVYVR